MFYDESIGAVINDFMGNFPSANMRNYQFDARIGGQLIQSEDYKNWSKCRHSCSNAYAYFDMVKERNYATRLEF